MLVNLFLTSGCNLRCAYCYVDKPSSAGIMSPQVALSSTHFVLDAARQQGSSVVGIGFSGGEPLLCWETMQMIVREAADRAKETDFTVSFIITTNGTLLTPEIARFFSQYDFKVSLSLDGPLEVHDAHRAYHNGRGSFADVEKAISILHEARHPAVARLTFTPATVSVLANSIRFIADSGFDVIKPVPDYFDMRWTAIHVQQCQTQFDHMLQWLPDYWAKGRNIQIGLIEERLVPRRVSPCRAGLTREQFSIAPSGDIYPCSYLVNHPGFTIGNVYEGINLDRAQKVHRLEEQPFAREICEGCRLFYTCDSGRCTFLNLKATGTMHTPSPFFCAFERLMYQVVSKYHALGLDEVRRGMQVSQVSIPGTVNGNLTECQ